MASGIEMDQGLAQRLLLEGATFILTGVPEGTELGIDMKSWNTGDKFLGIKMIPPGLHYIHYSATNRHGDIGPRIGFIHNFKKSEILVKKWDTEKEEMSNCVMPEDIVERFKDNLKNIDQFLGVYPYEVFAKWKNLTNKMNENMVLHLTPLCGQIRSALELIGSTNENRKESKSLNSSSNSENNTPNPKRLRGSGIFTDEKDDDTLLPHLTPVSGTELRLTKLPNKSYPEGSTPSEITKHSLDSSYVLGTILAQYDSPSDILSEIQFTFVCFLIGHSLEAFEQWKKLIGVMCSCDESLSKYISVYLDFLSILNFQLQEIPEDFLVDIVASNNFIYKCLRILFRTLYGSKLDDRLKTKAVRFQESLTQQFGWDFSDINDDDEDDLPVVVQI